MDPSNHYITSGDQIHAGGVIAAPRGYELSGKVMMSVIVALFAVVLLVFFLHLFIRWRRLRQASRRTRRRLRRRLRRLVFSGEGQDPAARGLDPAAIKTLPVIVHSVAFSGGADDVAECAVCLNEFEEGEKVRSLLRCDHRFHIECIDMWFHSHATCPLCRSDVEPVKPSPVDAGSMPEAQPSPSALRSSCRNEDGTAAASSSTPVRVEVPRGPEDEQGQQSCLKSPVGRIQAIRRLLSGGSVEETDLERGQAGEGAAPPGAPPPPPALAAQLYTWQEMVR